MNAVLERKRRALDEFVARVKRADVADDVVKMILHGSVVRGEAGPESGVDGLVIATGDVRQVGEAVGNIAYDVMLDCDELVSPMVYCVDVLRHPISYFVYRALQVGEEIYGMDGRTLKKKESHGYLALAVEYRSQSEGSLGHGYYRLAVDGAYNAAELCAKGFLLLKLEDIPRSHGGIAQKFGELYVKSGLLPREMGRGLNKGMELRNQARYEYHTQIGREEAESMLTLARKFIAALSAELEV